MATMARKRSFDHAVVNVLPNGAMPMQMTAIVEGHHPGHHRNKNPEGRKIDWRVTISPPLDRARLRKVLVPSTSGHLRAMDTAKKKLKRRVFTAANPRYQLADDLGQEDAFLLTVSKRICRTSERLLLIDDEDLGPGAGAQEVFVIWMVTVVITSKQTRPRAAAPDQAIRQSRPL